MDVKELLISKSVEYTSSGRDYKVHCWNPDHEDSNPSMNIDKITGIFHCYSCGYSGDIYAKYNINKEKIINIKIDKVMSKIHELLSTRTIPIPADAVYVNSDFRGISKSTLRRFGAFTTDSIRELEGRTVFPISNINRDIIGFQGRYTYSDLDPKYKFYPEHISPPLYPAVVKPINDSIILVEGLLDMINLHDKGLTNAVCTFGTAFGNVKKKDKIKRNMERLLQYKIQGIEKFWIMYDGDTAGQKASETLMKNMGDQFNMEDFNLPDGKDPGGLTQTEVTELRGILYD